MNGCDASEKTPLSARPSVSQILPNLFAGVVIGVSAVVTGSGVAALAFPGALQGFLFVALGAVLFSAVVHLAIMALFSSCGATVSLPQETPAAILGLMAAGLLPALPKTMPIADKAAAIILTFGASTALTGLCFMLLGQFRLGGLIRFIPYPVVGGVLASLGWLLVQGGFTVLTRDTAGLASLPVLWQPPNLFFIASGIAAGLALFAAARLFRHYLTLPLAMMTGVILFYLVGWLFGTKPLALQQNGWLLGPFPEGQPWSGPPLKALHVLDWSSILTQLPTIGTLILVSTISVLLYATGLELLVRRDIDLDRELRACGLSNFIAGLGGGMVGFHSMSDSMLASRMHASGRFAALCAATVLVAVLILGLDLLSYFPRPVLGGLLFYLGAGLLFEWLVSARRTLPVGDWAIVVTILLISAWFGYLSAISVGIFAGIVLFVVNYSRLDVAKYELTGKDFRSNVDRHDSERAVLDTHGHAIKVMTLQGFLFFGTANKILESVAAKTSDPSQKTRFVVLDFDRVSGMDSSCLLTFRKLSQMAEDRDFYLVFSGLSDDQVAMMHAEGLGSQPDGRVHFERDLDHGTEWCEEKILKTSGRATPDNPVEDGQDGALPSDLHQAGVQFYFEDLTLDADEYLIREGDSADAMYFVREGKVSVHLEQLGENNPKRLRIYGPGTVVGEIAMYIGGVRSASVITKTPVRVWRISRDALERMREENPKAAAIFHEYLARLLSERVTTTNQLLRRLL